MASMERSEVTPKKNKGRLARAFAKAFHKHSVTGIAPDKDADVHKLKLENLKRNLVKNHHLHPFSEEEDEKKLHKRALTDAFLANVFATISAVKAAYAELQYAQSPYDPDGIQSADEIVVSELKNLSELKKHFVKHHVCISSSSSSSPEATLVLAEIQEHKSLIKTYGVMTKKLDSEIKLKESEIIFLKEKLEEAIRENKLLEKRLSVSGVVQSSLKLSSLSTSHFVTFLHRAIRSIRRFVSILIPELESADWDLEAASNSIENGVEFMRSNHRCYAFESFVSHQMFDNFSHPESHTESFNETAAKDRKQLFFNEFMELKSVKKPMDYLLQNRESNFSRYCRFKYTKLVHPKMEQSLFGNLDQRKLIINAGEFPETSFFASFVEMAKHIWVLNCLAFSLNPEVSIFKANKGSRFSRVYMESVCDDDDDEHFLTSLNTDAQVAFTVIPGFRIGKTVIQCQVYLLTSCIDHMVQSHHQCNRVGDH